MGIKRYLKENWGAPFIIAFTVALILAAIELAYGLQDQANDVAVYAYYFLVIGVALQIASYVKYGEKGEEQAKQEPVQEVQEVTVKKKRTVSNRLKIVVAVVAVIVVISSVAFLISTGKVSLPVISTTTTPKLVASLSFAKSLKEPGGSVIIQAAVNAHGGKIPYNFTAFWSDGVRQNSTDPIFTRVINGTALPGYVIITVISSDGQRASVNATIPAPSG